MEKSMEEEYQARIKRFDDAISLNVPDRVPIATFASSFMARYSGITLQEAAYDYNKLAEAWKQSTHKLKWDMVTLAQGILPGSVFELLKVQTYRWAGYKLPDNTVHQFVENEYMLADEYRQFISNPGDFTIRTILPRVAKSFEPLAQLPPIQAFSFDVQFLVPWMGMPEIVQMLDTIREACTELKRRNDILSQLKQDLREIGHPVMSGSICTSPFDWIANCMRGMKGIMLDMFRNSDELLAAIEMLTPIAIEVAIKGAKKSANKYVFVPLHRGSGPFMSNEQFARFYWPSLKKELLALIDADLVPCVAWEGNWTSRLEFIAELPKGKVASCWDDIDIEKLKKLVGDRMCFWGNVPSQLLSVGKPQQVQDYVRMLIDTFGENGGLIVSPAAEPYDAKFENIEAMTEAVFKYGVYH